MESLSQSAREFLNSLNEANEALGFEKIEIPTGQKFTFFWGGIFSQWAPSEFTIDGMKFSHAEQYMMYKKAMLFGDTETANEIMKAAHPREQKALGRKVKGFDKDLWEQNCKQYVYDANYAKFTQNFMLLTGLMATGDTELVEASPEDKIWGIGLADTDPRAQNKETWQGTNWLGEILTKLREDLKTKDLKKMVQHNLLPPIKPEISYEDYEKLDIRLCQIISVEKVEKKDKLYKLEIDTGVDKRVVVSAIAHLFKPEELLLKVLPFVLNLKPREIAKIESHGMIVLADDKILNNTLQISSPNGIAGVGAIVI